MDDSAATDQVTSRPPFWRRWFDVLLATQRAAAANHARDAAAAITYWVFFSIFPMLFGIIALAGFFLDSAQVQEQVFTMVAEVLPGSAALIEEQLTGLVAARGTLGVIGLAGLMWSGSAGFGAMTRAVNRAWGTAGLLPGWRARIEYFVMTIGVAALLTVSIALTAIIEVAPELPGRPLADMVETGTIEQVRGAITSFVAILLTFLLVYKVTPNFRTTWRQALPGALLAAPLFEVAKAGFVFYLERFADFSIYGSLGSIVVMLLWFYASARVFVFCAEFNVVLDRARQPVG